MKKLLTIMLAVLMVAGLAACSKKETTVTESGPVETESDDTTEVETPTSDEETGLANPWVVCETLAEAEELAGYEFSAPESLEGYEGVKYQVIENFVLEVVYGEDGNQVILRKSAELDDALVGDYNEYSISEEKTVGELTVTVKGNEEGLYNNVLWNNDGHSYSIYADNGVDEALVETLVSEAK